MKDKLFPSLYSPLQEKEYDGCQKADYGDSDTNVRHNFKCPQVTLVKILLQNKQTKPLLTVTECLIWRCLAHTYGSRHIHQHSKGSEMRGAAIHSPASISTGGVPDSLNAIT